MATNPKALDFADLDNDNVIRAAIGAARATNCHDIEPPRPLRRPLRESDPYPVESLGDGIRRAVEAVANSVEAPVEICAQSALANAALAIQGHANVVLPFGGGTVRPTSLFLVSVAASGDRKSAVDGALGWAIEKHERNLADAASIARADYDNAMEGWNASRMAAKQEAKGRNASAIAAALNDVGAQPMAPLDPMIICSEPTLEGLQKYLATGQPSVGLFSDEGGQFIGGFAMSKENSLKTAAGLSKFWDGAAVRRMRAGEGSSLLLGRRVSFHLMVQPEAANSWLGDPVLRDQGLFSRMLVAAPRSLAGTRFGGDTHSGNLPAVNAFGARLLAILERPCPMAMGKVGELAPREVGLSHQAAGMLRGFNHAVERELAPAGTLRPVAPLAGKIHEHAARLAVVMALFDDLDVAEVDAAAMERGIALAKWYLGEALRLAEVGIISDDVRLGESLLGWLRNAWPHLATDGGKLVSPADVYQRGPGAIREKSVAMQAINVLVDHGWLRQVEGSSLHRMHGRIPHPFP